MKGGIPRSKLMEVLVGFNNTSFCFFFFHIMSLREVEPTEQSSGKASTNKNKRTLTWNNTQLH